MNLQDENLTDIIIRTIANKGPITFSEYMDIALYYPQLGYYTSSGDKIGKSGDYYTTPYFTTIFGELIAKQLEEMWLLLDKAPFTIVEYGAGTGVLCRDILNYLKKNEDLYNNLTYCIIEKSEEMREKERQIVDDKVYWYDSIKDIPKFTGCILSNELLDNFPVHLVVMDDELMEVYVDYDDKFVEVLKPSSPDLLNYFTELGVTLPKGYRTEVNLQALQWIGELGEALDKGFVLTVDYGFSAAEFYKPQRSSGSIICYYKHEVNENVYDKIGEQDITAHVNFSALVHWGIKNSLECTGFTNQANFMRMLGLVNHLKEMEENGTFNPAIQGQTVMLAYTLMLDMGSKFKVLVQHKGIQKPLLSGLQLSQKLV